MKVFIQIVTGQTMANLLPILAFKPEVVVMLISEKFAEKSKMLEQIFTQIPQLEHTKRVIFNHLPDSNGLDIQNFGLEVRTQLEEQFPKAKFFYDLTGGSKLMAVALAAVFTDENYTQLYLNTENNLFEYIEPQGKSPDPLADLIDAKTYLAINGAFWRSAQSEESAWQQKIEQRKAVTFSFATLLSKRQNDMQSLIPQLNRAASLCIEKGKKTFSAKQTINFLPRSCTSLMQALADHGLIDWSTEEEKNIYFKNEDAVNYINGGWLEEYFYLVTQQVNLTDSHCGVKIIDSTIKKTDSHNELDGLIAFNNRLLLTECKTAKIGDNEQKDNNILYKLDSIASHIGGQFCTRLLLSALPVDHVTRDNREVNVTARAKTVEVYVLAGKELINLREHLEFWKNNGKWKTTTN